MIVGNFLFLFVAYLFLFFIDDKFYEAYYAIFLSILTSSIFLKIAFKSKDNLYSPISLFVNVYNIYVIFGTLMWLYREEFFSNWDGEFFTVLRTYLATSMVITLWGGLQLERNGSYKEPPVSFIELRINSLIFICLLGLEYIGIFLYTAGFTIIPLLQGDIDESRFELGAVERPGAGIGLILIYCGIFCVIHSFYGIRIRMFKYISFIVSYIPFLLYGGRLMMIVPLIVCLLLVTIKKHLILNKKALLNISFFLISFFFLLMFYGTYRQQGEDTDADLLLNYASADLFPEVRGSMASFVLNKKDLTIPYISYIISMMLPGSVASMIGIDKGSQLSIGSYVANLLGFEGFGIRTSITGELLLTNPLSYILFWIGILLLLQRLNSLYFSCKNWGSDKVVYLYTGICFSTLIPYGITSAPNIIVTIIFMILVKKIVYKRRYDISY